MKISRRKFIRRTGVAGVAAFIGSYLLPKAVIAKLISGQADISIVEGTNYFENTILAVDAIGGMSSIVDDNDKVGILINADFEHYGTYVNPDVAAAVIKMVYDAGASEVIILQNFPLNYWERTGNLSDHMEMLNSVKIVTPNQFPANFEEENWIKAGPFPGAVSLTKESEMVRNIFEIDKFINIPIAKHHATTLYTGALKNAMGLCTRKTNVGMHLDSGVRNDPEFLAQCIADLNLVRKTDLIVVDASEVLVSNGPTGPGEVERHDNIVAGTDIVAVDAYCSQYTGFDSEEIITTQKAYELGMGEMDLNKIIIEKITGM